MKNEYHSPEIYQKGDKLGEGLESIVHELGPNMVVKEVQTLDENGKPMELKRVRGRIREEIIMEQEEVEEALERIFDPDHFAKTAYIPYTDKDGERALISAQRRVNGKNAKLLVGDEYPNVAELVRQNREEFIHLLWSTKKAFIEFGVPIDLHLGNFMLDEETGHFVLVDSGNPIKESKMAFSEDLGFRGMHNTLDRATQRILRLGKWEGYLDITDSEREELNARYGFTESEYTAQVDKVKKAGESVGITEETAQDELDIFLKNVLGDRTQINGGEVANWAIKVLGDQKPDKQQERVLEELENRKDEQGDQAYWKRVIEDIINP